MSRSIISTVATAVVMALAAPVGAATFDFGRMANDFWNLASGPGGRPFEPSFQQFADSSLAGALEDEGVRILSAVATQDDGRTAHAFLDHDLSRRQAGLGVCSSGFLGNGVSECSTGFGNHRSDDNITEGETVAVTFDQQVAFTDLEFRDAQHFLANGTLLIGGQNYVVDNGRLAASDVSRIGRGSTFSFGYGGENPTEIYLTVATVAPVPLPAGIGLLAAALGGLAGLRRMRRRADA